MNALFHRKALRMAISFGFLFSGWSLPAESPALKDQVQKAISRGRAWLEEHQDAKTGAWGNPDQPALTAMALLAFLGDPSVSQPPTQSAHARRAYAFIRTQAREDGGIYGKGLVVYNTALCLSCLLLDDDEQSRALVPAAKRFLLKHQSGSGLRVESGDAVDAEGGGDGRPDFSRTLDSLRQFQSDLNTAPSGEKGPSGLDLEAAIKFVQRCQTPSKPPENLPSEAEPNDAPDVPPEKPAADAGPAGKVALRHSGVLSYDALLSLIYDPLEIDDTRVDAFLDWLDDNYTIEENPGLGTQGMFYYYHSIAKVLTIRRIDRFRLKSGTEIDWRTDLANKILAAQNKDGSWVNANGRWWENDPVLVSAYAMLTLEQLAGGL